MLEKLSRNSKLLEKALDAAWLRNEVISQNIANVDTPGYKSKTVAFEEHLSQAMEGRGFKLLRTDKRHMASHKDDVDKVDIKVTVDRKAMSIRLDGNNVDIDNEMASMAKNTIKYNVLIQSLNAGFRRLKSVISEGRR